MRRRRPKIQWTTSALPEKQKVKDLRPHPYMGQNNNGSREHEERFFPKLVPGTLWRVAVPLRKEVISDHWQNHEFPYLHALAGPWDDGATFPKDTVAIYFGEVRVEESMRDGKVIRVHRHGFLIGGSRFITKNLVDFEPVLP